MGAKVILASIEVSENLDREKIENLLSRKVILIQKAKFLEESFYQLLSKKISLIKETIENHNKKNSNLLIIAGCPCILGLIESEFEEGDVFKIKFNKNPNTLFKEIEFNLN